MPQSKTAKANRIPAATITLYTDNPELQPITIYKDSEFKGTYNGNTKLPHYAAVLRVTADQYDFIDRAFPLGQPPADPTVTLWYFKATNPDGGHAVKEFHCAGATLSASRAYAPHASIAANRVATTPESSSYSMK